MPPVADSTTARKAASAARSRKYYANIKARTQQIINNSRHLPVKEPPYQYEERPVFSFTLRDWSEGRVSFRRLPNPDVNSTSTVILVLTPRVKHDGYNVIPSDQLPQTATSSPGNLRLHWKEVEGQSVENPSPQPQGSTTP